MNEEAANSALPWTDKPFLDDPQEFHFAIIADRTGDERPGPFGEAMKALNLLRPEFAICVGDIVQGGYAYRDEASCTEGMNKQWDEAEAFISQLDMRFFYVVGNHDINLGWPTHHLAHDVSKRVWHERHGGKGYYDFMYKGCHFVCLDSMDGRDGRMPLQGITDEQYAWALETIRSHKTEARWTLIFMHMPIDWTSDKWLAFERQINDIDYTLFCGDWHNHVKAVRHGKNYYMIGTTGGCFDFGVKEDLRYGIMDSITWVTMTRNGPVVSNLRLDGIFGDDIQRCATTKGWIETPLDYPDHKTVGDGLDEERTDGGTYDWHFRHALILRNDAFIVKPEVVIAGDGIIHRWGGLDWYGDTSYPRPPELNRPFFNEHRVLNIGCIGDKCENLLWRLRHGELEATTPKCVILHIGMENLLAGDTPEKTAAAVMRNVAALHAIVPMAYTYVLGPLERPEGSDTLNALLQKELATDARAEFLDLSAAYLQGGTAALEEYFMPRMK